MTDWQRGAGVPGSLAAGTRPRVLAGHYESRGGAIETVSLWIEASDEVRKDRFTIEVDCPKAATVAKALPEGALVEAAGKLRHDRWKDKTTSRWTGRVCVAIEPGGGTLRSKGMASAPERQTEAA